MEETVDAFGSRIERVLSAAGLVAVAASVVFGMANAAPSRSQSQTQPQATDASDPKFAAFVYDVVSIKPHKDDPNPRGMAWAGMQFSPDGVTMRAVDLNFMISAAYGGPYSKITGLTAWALHDTYDVEAKMEPEVADALQKLSPADQKLARKHLMQAFVGEYFKAAVHVETTEVATYDLVIAKHGPKLKETTDPITPESGFRATGSQAGMVLEAHGATIESMVGQLTGVAGRPVYDKTGLTGRYDFTLKYSSNSLPPSPGPDGVAAPPIDDSPPIAKALEEQLGLKLVPARGNTSVIVVDHVERPPGN